MNLRKLIRSSIFSETFFSRNYKDRFRQAHKEGKLNRRFERRMKNEDKIEPLAANAIPLPSFFTAQKIKALITCYEEFRNKTSYDIKMDAKEKKEVAKKFKEFSEYEVNYFIKYYEYFKSEEMIAKNMENLEEVGNLAENLPSYLIDELVSYGGMTPAVGDLPRRHQNFIKYFEQHMCLMPEEMSKRIQIAVEYIDHMNKLE